ncbi:MAG: MlaE family lipid ABC transporter permease subunit [Phenylobacterium sp.]
MERPADFSLREAGGKLSAVLTGDWTAYTLGEAGANLGAALGEAREVQLDLSEVGRFDTAGAYAVYRAARGRLDPSTIQGRPEAHRLLTIVDEAMQTRHPVASRPEGVWELLGRIGKAVVELGVDAMETVTFIGHLLVVFAKAVVRPHKIRWAACVSLAERAGLDAIPIVAVTSFFIGAVVGMLGANMLRQFGAEVFAVELIGIAVLREFGIIITAVLLAGRSASSFAAEIGSMKMNQEVDAMKVMGVDPFEALVFPRFMALVLMIPLLTFVADVAGLTGGLVVSWTVLELGPAFYLQRIADNVGFAQFWPGMLKAPVMAAVIAGIGCRQGLEVGGDVESLGRRVTAAVVHAIFAIILIDAAFALIYMELDV